jgi:hypothetical protein
MNNYNLEDAIYMIRQTTDDLNLFLEHYLDFETPMTEDEVANVLIGLIKINDMRYEKLWDCYIRHEKLDKYAPPEKLAYREALLKGLNKAFDDASATKKKKK